MRPALTLRFQKGTFAPLLKYRCVLAKHLDLPASNLLKQLIHILAHLERGLCSSVVLSLEMRSSLLVVVFQLTGRYRDLGLLKRSLIWRTKLSLTCFERNSCTWVIYVRFPNARAASFLLKNTRIDYTDHHQTRHNQSESNKSDEEDTASAGWEFAPYDPILLYTPL